MQPSIDDQIHTGIACQSVAASIANALLTEGVAMLGERELNPTDVRQWILHAAVETCEYERRQVSQITTAAANLAFTLFVADDTARARTMVRALRLLGRSAVFALCHRSKHAWVGFDDAGRRFETFVQSVMTESKFS